MEGLWPRPPVIGPCHMPRVKCKSATSAKWVNEEEEEEGEEEGKAERRQRE